MLESFDPLRNDLLQRAEGRRVALMVVDGNLGDGLIRLGAEHFLDACGIDYQKYVLNSRPARLRALLRSTRPYASKSRPLVIFNGGGGWAAHCSTAERGVELQEKFNSNVLVLPSTVERARLAPMPRIYRRDDGISMQMLPDAPFCHDMAFYLSRHSVETWYPGKSRPVVNRQLGIFFRTDNESRYPALRRVDGNLDISAMGASGGDVVPFLNAIESCREVATDRLHVAIGGALLGKRVHLVEGASSKIRDIYESSLKPYFKNVELISEKEAVRITDT